MNSDDERLIYDEVADKIKLYTADINKVLSNCSLISEFSTKDTEEKFDKIFNLETTKLFKNEQSSEYYNLDKVTEILEMIDSSKFTDGGKKLTRGRIDSVLSLHSVTDDDEKDNLHEIKSQMKETRELLGQITNTHIEEQNLNDFKVAETQRNNKFFEMVFNLQKIARELTSIASMNRKNKEELPDEVIDNQFIERIITLDKCLENILELQKNKNPIENVERREDIKLKVSSTMNAILEALKKHSMCLR
ncbi:hypothetical protein PVAND_008860 [Polypedilum vanderplanki]|uniref:Uncharacterized protein n=1 Tax=Polypedilum vanderplanki TaxID=319348 RepID=A0A9J6CAX1_POLVA|nr:hypothetical protein PVAND_008860 [Polypedilum vanderplanki]